MRKHIGIFEMEDIRAIQSLTSFEYIEEIEAVDSIPGKQLYRVVLSDTYVEEGGTNNDCARIFR